MKTLDKIIKNIWINNIQTDYGNGLILNEDTLKNTLYFHLRTYFESNTSFKNLYIYTECTEYGFSSLSYRPDMIIVDIQLLKIIF